MFDDAEDRWAKATLFADTGRALFGEKYRSDLAGALGVSISRIKDWSKGRQVIPGGVWDDLGRMVAQRDAALSDLAGSVAKLARGESA